MTPAIRVAPVAASRLRDLALALLGRLIPEGADLLPPEARLLRAAAEQLRDLVPGGLLAATRATPAPFDAPLVRLGDALGLEDLEILVAALARAVESEALVGRALAWLQAPLGGSRPTLGLLQEAFAALGDAPALLAALAGGKAVASGLLELDGESLPLIERPVRLPAELALALDGVTPRLAGARVLDDAATPVPSLRSAAERRARLLDHGSARLLLIRSGEPADGEAAAAAVAAVLGRRALVLPSGTPPPRSLGPLCTLAALIPVLALDLAPGERWQAPALPGYRGPVVLLAGPDGSIEEAQDLLEWRVARPRPDERERLWRAHLADQDLARRLAADHLHRAGRIALVGARARLAARLRGAAKPSPADLRAAAFDTASSALDGLAQPVRGEVDDDAFIAPSTLRADLELLVARCCARDELGEELGPALAARFEPGVRVLFAGPSGTGKTMAAAWLATRLGLPLYRVDLAQVTSKYIGETEKNLARLLARAEAMEVVLLFDEADSLFGRRTEVKEANDRFANAQTNYLLQRIETYSGIVVLTANSRARLDPAFARRLDMVLEFPLPGPEARRALWLAHLGDRHALPPGELNRLSAACDLTGGQIRNVVLLAAVSARDRGQRLALQDVAAGLAAEYRKLGRALPREIQSEG